MVVPLISCGADTNRTDAQSYQNTQNGIALYAEYRINACNVGFLCHYLFHG